MFKKALSVFGLSASFLLGGCESLLLPDFNGGLLNPDIRFLKAGEVMNGVKCAMTEFMREREQQLLDEREKIVEHRDDPDPAARRRFLLLYGSEYKGVYQANAAGIYRGNQAVIRANRYGTLNELNPFALNADKVGADRIPLNAVDRRAGTTPEGPRKFSGLCWPDREGVNKGRPRHFYQGRCVLNAPNESFPNDPESMEAPCPQQIGITLWDYKPKDQSRGVTGSNCVRVPDYSRFALDPSQQALIDLTLTGNNQGTIFYDTVKQAGLGSALQTIITPGNRQTGAVFPKLDITAKGVTTFDMSVQMPQTIFQSVCLAGNIPNPDAIDTAKGADPLAGLQCQIPDGAPLAAHARLRAIPSPGKSTGAEKQFQEKAAPLPPSIKTRPVPDRLTAREVNTISKELTPFNQFKSGCGQNGLLPVDDVTEIDYLALKDMLLNVVARQNEDVSYRGGPEVALDTLNLTSSFEIVLDMSAGTKHIFRLLPMVLPPQMGLRPDHIHTLKITLKGAKRKGDPNSGGHLLQSCLALVGKAKAHPGGSPSQAAAGFATNDAEHFCNSPGGQLLTSIADSLASGGGSSGGGGGAAAGQ